MISKNQTYELFFHKIRASGKKVLRKNIFGSLERVEQKKKQVEIT